MGRHVGILDEVGDVDDSTHAKMKEGDRREQGAALQPIGVDVPAWFERRRAGSGGQCTCRQLEIESDAQDRGHGTTHGTTWVEQFGSHHDLVEF